MGMDMDPTPKSEIKGPGIFSGFKAWALEQNTHQDEELMMSADNTDQKNNLVWCPGKFTMKEI